MVDFTHAIAGPTMTRVLAEFGAEVIKIESQQHNQRGRVRPSQPRPYRQQIATFVDLNRNKLSFALSMDSEQGRDLARRLIARSDVVVNNFSPRVMRRWNLDYDHLRALRPDIIGIDMPGYGLDGPHQEFLAGAVIVQALSGAFHLWDYRRGGPPASPPSWYADYGTGIMAAMATVAALYHRDVTGEGQQIEQSQLEAIATYLAPAYMDYLANGVDEGPIGVRSPEHAPYGPYPCRGDDQWCVIAVESDEQWGRLVAEMGSPKWAQDPALATAAGRLAVGEELDRRVGEWTRQWTPHQVMRRLQRAGVPAGVVVNGEDLYHDPHLRARGYLQPVDHPGTGPWDYPGLCVRLSATPGEVGRVARFGEHNEYVLREVIGLDEEEIERLRNQGVFT